MGIAVRKKSVPTVLRIDKRESWSNDTTDVPEFRKTMKMTKNNNSNTHNNMYKYKYKNNKIMIEK